MLEVAAVERLCLLAPLPDDSLAACQQAAAQCIEAGRSRDVSEYVEADRTFHLRLTGMLGNERLNSIVDRVRDEIRLYGLLKVSRVDLVAFAQEHQALLDAVRAGDGIGAATVLRTHLSHTRAVWAASAAADSR
jgi:DNA-binding GntR family transcriptional regulator